MSRSGDIGTKTAESVAGSDAGGVMSDKTCQRCGKPREKGRTRYCSEECWALAVADREKARRAKRMQACKRCGGEKPLGVRGGRFCEPCREAVADAFQLYERERSRRRQAKKMAEREANGEPVMRRADYVEGHKWCPRCKEYRAVDHFPKRKDPGKPATYCRPCQRAYNAERRLTLTFGMTWDDYEFLLASQDYRCAICNGRPRKHVLAVDHDHNTGEIRGLLCSRCNHRLLGSANDDPARLRKAADYLEAFGAREVFGEPRYVPGSKGGVA